MPIAEVIETVFIDYVDKPLIDLLRENNESVSQFQKSLRDRSYRIRGEISNETISQNFNHSNFVLDLKRVIGKIERFEKDRFHNIKNVIHYRYDNINIIVNKDGARVPQFVFFIYDYCQEIKKILNDSINDIGQQLKQENFNIENSKTLILKEPYGFKIKNENNLNGAWLLLRNKKNKFIDPSVTYPTFRRNFTRKRITSRIIWTGSDNSLHFFIDGIYGTNKNYGLGVEKEDGGQWEKASECFVKKNGKTYNPKNLSRTKDPTDKDKEKLTPIISNMNKLPKKDGLT